MDAAKAVKIDVAQRDVDEKVLGDAQIVDARRRGRQKVGSAKLSRSRAGESWRGSNHEPRGKSPLSIKKEYGKPGASDILFRL
jgi:hypothetical protein